MRGIPTLLSVSSEIVYKINTMAQSIIHGPAPLSSSGKYLQKQNIRFYEFTESECVF